MTAVESPTATPGAEIYRRERTGGESAAPIVAAVDGNAASRAVVDEAVRLAAELDVPLVFLHVRDGRAGVFGEPVYQRRLTKKMAGAQRVLDGALAFATRAGVPAEAETLEGSPRRRIAEFARDRGASLVVVGSRKRKYGLSVSSGVVRAAERPVVVARDLRRPAAAAESLR